MGGQGVRPDYPTLRKEREGWGTRRLVEGIERSGEISVWISLCRSLLAAHPPVHQRLRATGPAQMAHLGRMRQQDVPLRQLQHGLLRGGRNQRRRLSHRQPPIFRIAPWIAADIAVVGLSNRLTNYFSVPQGTRGKLAGASLGDHPRK